MSATYKLISKLTLSSDSALITLSGIPQNYTDLLVRVSSRTTRESTVATNTIYFNGSATNLSYRSMWNYVPSVYSYEGVTDGALSFYVPGGHIASNVFGDAEIYINNYSKNINKSVNISASYSSNSTSDYTYSNLAGVGFYSNTNPITSITLSNRALDYAVYKAGTTVYLYGISAAADENSPGTFGIQATGGDVTISGGYKYHVFKSSGTFTVTEPGWAEMLVIGGGGSGGGRRGGGGGAGGICYVSGSLLQKTSMPVLVGAGAAATTYNTNGSNGTDTSISNIIGFGGGGGGNQESSGKRGGSGGGSGTVGSGPALVGGTAAQITVGFQQGFGNNGGTGSNAGESYAAAGGGGAGAPGANVTNSFVGAAGGAGLNTWASWASATGTGVSGFFAGGGGGGNGGGGASGAGAGGSGGGGNGGASGSTSGVAGTINTGSGGGGASLDTPATGGAGGSGIVIIRYPVS